MKKQEVLAAFWKKVTYVSGTYDTPEGFIKLNNVMAEMEKQHGGEKKWVVWNKSKYIFSQSLCSLKLERGPL